MTKRNRPVLAAAATALWLAAAPAAVAADTQSARLVSVSRGQVTVGGGVVRLGDLFTNTGDKSARIVDDAPSPGAQRSFDVYRLAAIARAHGLTWQAQSWSEKVVIERAAQVLPGDVVLAALRTELHKQAIPGEKFEIDMAGRDLTLTLPAEARATVAVENLRLNRAGGQFSATIAAPAGDGAAVRVNVAGRVHPVIDVPMLNKRLANGDIIGENDIDWITMRASAISRNMITDIERLIGMTPARTVMSGKPLMNGDVRAPRLVLKGSMVTMILKTPHMVLTSKGKAMQHGAKGQTVRIMNTQSKSIIEGEVTAAGMVLVTASTFTPLGVAQAPATNGRK